MIGCQGEETVGGDDSALDNTEDKTDPENIETESSTVVRNEPAVTIKHKSDFEGCDNDDSETLVNQNTTVDTSEGQAPAQLSNQVTSSHSTDQTQHSDQTPYSDQTQHSDQTPYSDPPLYHSPKQTPPQTSLSTDPPGLSPDDQYTDRTCPLLSLLPKASFSSTFSSLPTGLHWSPCGDHLAVSTDTSIQVYSPWQSARDHTDLTTTASIKHAECLYSWQWSTGSTSSSPSMLVTSGRYQPVQLYTCQTTTGYPDLQLASTYKCINQLDELSHAFSVALDQTASTLYCGLKGEVRVFDVTRPGRHSICHLTRGGGGQSGIVSCLAVCGVVPVYAAGCYDRTVGLYSVQGDRLCVLRGQVGGVTQVTFSKDGTKLFAGGRKDNEILCWDLRQPGMVLYTLQRKVSTNQTIQFTLSPCGKYLSSANTDGSVRVWDLDRQADSETGVLEPVTGWLLHRDAVSGVSWHPGGEWLASCSGQRHFKLDREMDMDGEFEEEENGVVVWSLE